MQKSELDIFKNALNEVAHVFITDGNGDITYVNDKYCRLSKYTFEELIGKNNRIFKSGYHSREFYSNMYAELNQGKTFKTKFKNRAKDGSIYWVEATIIPFLDENSIPYQFLTVQFDITDKIHEAELKEQFLGDVSHEIRTPLHGLQSFISFLSESDLSIEQVGYMSHIEEIADHLGGLIGDLLDFYKIDSSKLKLEQTSLDIKQIVNSLVEMFTVKERIRQIDFDCTIDDNISNLLLGDSMRLRQTLFNLLDNILKYKDVGLVTVRVKLSGETSEFQTIEFHVLNSGTGNLNQEQNQILDNGSQSLADNIGMQTDAGLGMTIVKRLIELQKGSILIDGVDGRDGNIVFSIPFKKELTSNNMPVNQSIKSETSVANNYNILIAEDDKINQMIFEKQMQRFNYSCRVADNGFDALKLLNEENFDLMLLDMQMPGMHGDEVLRKIRKEFVGEMKEIPVICVSATVHPKLIETIMEAGANGYLSKPYKEQELKDIIDATLSGKNKLHEDENLESQSTRAYVNLDLLNQIADGETEFVIELLEYFRSTAPDELERMQQNYANQNIDLASQLHKYRSQVSLLGHEELTGLTLELENKLIESANFEGCRTDFAKLVLLTHKLVAEVTNLIVKLKTA
ncbi:MAG: response regulator [Paludibacter sp.]|nr:response regulator [Paludibacter sp.]